MLSTGVNAILSRIEHIQPNAATAINALLGMHHYQLNFLPVSQSHLALGRVHIEGVPWDHCTAHARFKHWRQALVLGFLIGF